MAFFDKKDPRQPHGGSGRPMDHHDARRHEPMTNRPPVHKAPLMRGSRGEMVHFAFKQVSFFGNDKHVHVQLWVDGHMLSQGGHGMGEVTVQMLPGHHTLGLAVYNPDAMFDSRHPHQPESTASFVLNERRTGLIAGLFANGHERHVVIEYAVHQNLLTKAAAAEIRRVKTLR